MDKRPALWAISTLVFCMDMKKDNGKKNHCSKCSAVKKTTITASTLKKTLIAKLEFYYIGTRLKRFLHIIILVDGNSTSFRHYLDIIYNFIANSFTKKELIFS